MFQRAFWIAAIERAIKTFAQTAVALIGGDAVLSIVDVDAGGIAGISGTAAVVSVLTSLASIPLSQGSSPSLVPDAEVKAASS
jgi:hypothetical protein